MKRTTGIVLALALGMGGTWVAAPAWADDMDRTRDMDRTHDMDQMRTMDQDREMIYGSQLMTEQERNEYRERIRMAKTQQERDQIRAEHHKEMLARAKERGVVLPDEPMSKGGMMGEKGMGTGMGGGHGMGRH